MFERASWRPEVVNKMNSYDDAAVRKGRIAHKSLRRFKKDAGFYRSYFFPKRNQHL